MDFAEEYGKIMKKSVMFHNISGRDAYAPMLMGENEKNREFFKEICGLMDEMNVG